MANRGLAVSGSQAVALFLGADQASDVDETILNTGTCTVYLDETLGVSPGSGIALRAGSSLVWASGRPGFAIADPGNTGQVNVTDVVSGMVDAGGIAGQLLAQGLPAAIAQQANLLGIPPVNNAVLLASFLNQALTPNQDAVFYLPNLEAYQTIEFAIQEGSGDSGYFTRNYYLTWTSWDPNHAIPAYDIPTAVEYFSGMDMQNVNNADPRSPALTTYQTPVKANYLTVRAKGTGATGTTISLKAYGSYKSIGAPRYSNQPTQAYTDAATNGWTATGSGTDGFASLSIGSMLPTSRWYPPSMSGPATMFGQINGGTLYVNITDVVSGFPIMSKMNIGSTGLFTQGIIIPRRPVRVDLFNPSSTVAATGINIAIAYQGT